MARVSSRETGLCLVRRTTLTSCSGRSSEQAWPTPVYVVRDGAEAIQYLNGEGPFSNRDEYPLPALVLLDLKMPRVDGFEVLKWVRAQPGLRTLLVVVLTSSEDLRDVNRAYELGANSFLVKRMDFENSVALGELINNYWLLTNSQPKNSRPQCPVKPEAGTL